MREREIIQKCKVSLFYKNFSTTPKRSFTIIKAYLPLNDYLLPESEGGEHRQQIIPQLGSNTERHGCSQVAHQQGLYVARVQIEGYIQEFIQSITGSSGGGLEIGTILLLFSMYT